MPYYRGDYYRGDYYRGDSIFKRIGRGLGGLATGGIGGAISGFFTEPKKGGSAGPPAPPSGGIYDMPLVGGVAKKIRQATHPSERGARPKKGEPGYRGRHMNPLNVKALRRADRRARSFLRISRSVVRHYVAKQPKGRSYIHTKARKRA